MSAILGVESYQAQMLPTCLCPKNREISQSLKCEIPCPNAAERLLGEGEELQAYERAYKWHGDFGIPWLSGENPIGHDYYR